MLPEGTVVQEVPDGIPEYEFRSCQNSLIDMEQKGVNLTFDNPSGYSEFSTTLVSLLSSPIPKNLFCSERMLHDGADLFVLYLFRRSQIRQHTHNMHGLGGHHGQR